MNARMALHVSFAPGCIRFGGLALLEDVGRKHSQYCMAGVAAALEGGTHLESPATLCFVSLPVWQACVLRRPGSRLLEGCTALLELCAHR